MLYIIKGLIKVKFQNDNLFFRVVIEMKKLKGLAHEVLNISSFDGSILIGMN
jgi:hypothetical protein